MSVADDGEPGREDVDGMVGPVLLEFGASRCPHCQALAPKLAALLEHYPRIRHIKIEDGPGRPLGRSFRVKVWPNLVFLRDGRVVEQLARPDEAEVEDGLKAIDSARNEPVDDVLRQRTGCSKIPVSLEILISCFLKAIVVESLSVGELAPADTLKPQPFGVEN